MDDTWFNFGMSGVVLLTVVSCGAAIVAIDKDNKEWAVFAKEQDCKVVQRIDPIVAYGTGVMVSPSGTASVITIPNVTPSKVAFLCNDGITYWR